MRLLIFVLGLAAFAYAEHFSYEGYKLFRLFPTRSEDIDYLQTLTLNDDYDFWTKTLKVGQFVDILVKPKEIIPFMQELKSRKLYFIVLIENVELAVQAERDRQNVAARSARAGVSFDRYLRYGEIQDYLKDLGEKYSDIVTVLNIGKTTKGKDITAIKISKGNVEKPTILIDGAIHGREWIAPALSLYVINQLLENPYNIEMIEHVNWIILPVFNPDGYEFTHTNIRFWRKTLSDNPPGRCYGVDINRNFDSNWLTIGASKDECSDTFAGVSPLSEPETLAFRNFVLENAKNIKLYLSLHSYGNMILYPWGYTTESVANEKEYAELAAKVESAIFSYKGTHYKMGPASTTYIPVSGDSLDWAAEQAKIDLSITMELTGGGYWGYDLPAEDILRVVSETFVGIREMHKYVEGKYSQN